MPLNKNSIIFLGLFLSFLFGLAFGYSLKGDKSADQGISTILSGDRSNIQDVKANLPAGKAYDIALAEVRQWQKDAYLAEINLASKKFDSNGAANGWKFNFYSKSKNKSYEVLIKDGESRGGEESVAAKAPQTLKGEMVDSSSLAKSFYGAYPTDTEIVSLKMYYDPGMKKFIWTVFFPKGSHTIDAEI